ncbi:MAG: BON domain-containing protein [Chthoniobacterales bacterium]
MKRTLLSLLCLSALTLAVSAEDNPSATPTPADNSAQNTRDRSGETKTAGDQSNSSADVKITADIRRAIIKDDSLSITAKNIKIITADGVVTLRGPVKSAAEKTTIAKLAHANSGDAKVMNELEVEASK